MKHIEEDVERADRGYDKYIDSTGKERHLKTRTGKIGFEASKAKSKPSQDTTSYKKQKDVAFTKPATKKPPIKFSHGDEDGQKGLTERKTFADFTEELVQADTTSRMGDMVDCAMKNGGIDPRAVMKGKIKLKKEADDDRKGCTTSVDDLRKEDMDYTLDEFIELLQSEEYAALDEISKQTVASYIKKAAASMHHHGYNQGKKEAEADEIDRFRNRTGPLGGSKVADQLKKQGGVSSSDISKHQDKAWNRNSGIRRAVDRLSKEQVELGEMTVEPHPHGINVGDKVQLAKNQWGGPSGGYHDEKHTVTRVTPTHISIKTKHGVEDHHKIYVRKVNEDVDMTFAQAAATATMGTPQVVTVVQHPSDSNKYAVAVADPRKNEMDKVTMYKYVSTHDTEDAARKAAEEFAKMNKIPHVDGLEEAKKDDPPPFDPPFKKFKSWVKDKSGAKHGPMSRAHHLARMALKKNVKEETGVELPDFMLDLIEDSTRTYHDVKKTKTGAIYTKQYSGEDDDTGTAKPSGYEIAKAAAGEKRGRGRPTKDPEKIAAKKYGGALDLQKLMGSKPPKKPKQLAKLPKTVHKIVKTDEAVEFLSSLDEDQLDAVLGYISEDVLETIFQELNDQGE